MRRPALALVAGIAVLAATLVAAPAVRADQAAGADTRYETIPGAGGTPLKALVVTPRGLGDGPFPLLVMPSSWGMPHLEYVGAAAKLAYESGYAVVSYSSRGFWDSGGQVDVADRPTVRDVSKVIDWAVANAHADPRRVGAMGVSYGAGTSLLAAASDSRIKAVGALSTWTELPASLYPNQTVNKQAGELLLALAHLTGRPAPVLREVEASYRRGDMERAVKLLEGHSPAEYMDRLNANRPAVFLGNAWADSMFPPGTVTDFFTELTGPKKLMLGPGDHSSQEAFGLAGLPNAVWDTAARWMDHYVAGEDNGIAAEDPVVVKAPKGENWAGYPSWPAFTGEPERLHLGAGGALAPEPATGWRTTIDANVPTAADSGTAIVTGTLQGLGLPAATSLPLVARHAAGVWVGAPRARPGEVRGAPRLRATVTPSAADTSLFAYLYDVDATGTAALVTHKPLSLRDATPGEAQRVDLGLDPISWHVPAGHRLALVVDTVDPRYKDVSTPKSTVTFSSPADAPSTLTVPLAG
ncbi:MAG: CocE/NonD family hydrolase [Streptosporangiales bacterium]|nr:CocE/NonD family hydrolase [Streptosporangiales bacterium]